MEGVIKHTRTVAHANAKPILSFLASPPPSPVLSFPFLSFHPVGAALQVVGGRSYIYVEAMSKEHVKKVRAGPTDSQQSW